MIVKRILILQLICLFLTSCSKNKPLVANSLALNATYNAGKIASADMLIKHTFLLKSTGDADLKIDTVVASCDCVTINWQKGPIKPGNTGYISVVVKPNPASKGNKVAKYVMVKTNAIKPLTAFSVFFTM